jgi:hypothetical protein
MKWAALGLTIFLISLALYALWTIGGMPGRIAAARNHPKAEAINVGSWATLILGVIGWPWVLMWAYSHPAPEASTEKDRELADGTTGESE